MLKVGALSCMRRHHTNDAMMLPVGRNWGTYPTGGLSGHISARMLHNSRDAHIHKGQPGSSLCQAACSGMAAGHLLHAGRGSQQAAALSQQLGRGFCHRPP